MFIHTGGRRGGFALGFFLCAAALAFVYYLQYVQGLNPCPLCIFQRIAMAATGLVLLLGALHGSPGFGRFVYAFLGALCAAVGVAIAARHVWIQSLPADQIPACGPPLRSLVGMLPPLDVIRTVLRGDGECHKVKWLLLGLSLPWWSMFGFMALSIWSLLSGRRHWFFKKRS